MSVIYEPKGRAREYCELALNLYRGCSHGCTYCYAPAATHNPRPAFDDAKPRLRVFATLEKEASQLRGREVFLCFSCDPYQPLDDEYQLTRQAIRILHGNGVAVRILTKGGMRSKRDFDLLLRHPGLSFYGATLTFLDNAKSLKWEPDAAIATERIAVLQEAKKQGLRTWASLEPVISPDETLDIIRATHECVDVYKVGRWNHDKEANNIDYADFLLAAEDLLNKYGKHYYIKNDLLNCRGGSDG